MKRRDFLKTMLASGVAPAYIGSSVLMPVKEIISIHSPLTTTQMLERERLQSLMFERMINPPAALQSSGMVKLLGTQLTMHVVGEVWL